MYRQLDPRDIAARYRNGESVVGISKDLCVSYCVIKKRLVDFGVRIRTHTDAVVWAMRRNRSAWTGRPRVHAVNESFFENLGPNVGYVIGLIQADGNVDERRIRISLKASDFGLLESVAAVMGTKRPTIRRNGILGEAAWLEICSKKLADGIARWGVRSPKTFTASTHVALRMDRDYWRGVVDGDGTVCVTTDNRMLVALVGSGPICRQFLAFCRSNKTGNNVTVRPHASIFSVRISGLEAVRMARVLYENAGLSLERKRKVAEAWMAKEAA